MYYVTEPRYNEIFDAFESVKQLTQLTQQQLL